MTLDTAALLALSALIGLNQTTARVDALLRSKGVYAVTVALNGLVGLAILAFGLPGLPPVVGWIVAGLLILHVVQVTRGRSELQEEDRLAEREARRRERQALAESDDGDPLSR